MRAVELESIALNLFWGGMTRCCSEWGIVPFTHFSQTECRFSLSDFDLLSKDNIAPHQLAICPERKVSHESMAGLFRRVRHEKGATYERYRRSIRAFCRCNHRPGQTSFSSRHTPCNRTIRIHSWKSTAPSGELSDHALDDAFWNESGVDRERETRDFPVCYGLPKP